MYHGRCICAGGSLRSSVPNDNGRSELRFEIGVQGRSPCVGVLPPHPILPTCELIRQRKMGDLGFEPRTSGLRVRCATVALVTHWDHYIANFICMDGGEGGVAPCVGV